MAATSDGGYLVADGSAHRIRFVAANGTIDTVAGDGTQCSPAGSQCGDGGLATDAQLNNPHALAALPDGGFLIADTVSDRIRRVTAGGQISTVAGNGTNCTSGPCGDGGPATSAGFGVVEDIAVVPTGGFLLADQATNGLRRIRFVSSIEGGTISTVAGSGAACSGPADPCGDGGPALAAQFGNPTGLAAESSGAFLVADLTAGRIRRVTQLQGGTISTVAGNGSAATSGDGGPATAAGMNQTVRLEIAPDGSLLIADRLADRVRRVSPSGRISTVAGTGILACSDPAAACGDGGPATLAGFNDPFDAEPTADGGFLIPDRVLRRVRYVDADLRPLGSGPAGPQGQPGQQGTPGATGTPGTTGPQGPAGQPGSVFARLLIAIVDERVRSRRSKRATLRYLVTVDSDVVADVLRGRRRVGRARANAGPGRNRVRLPRVSAPGRYTVRLTARSEDGQSTADQIPLTVSR